MSGRPQFSSCVGTLHPNPADSDDSRDCDLGGPSIRREPAADSTAQPSVAAASRDSSAQAQATGSSKGGRSTTDGGVLFGGHELRGKGADAGLNGSTSFSASGVGKTGSSSSCGNDRNGTREAESKLLELKAAPGAPLSSHGSGLRCLAASTSGEALVSGDSDGDLCIWGVPPAAAAAAAATAPR
jgi:hypothetical protein